MPDALPAKIELIHAHHILGIIIGNLGQGPELSLDCR